VLCGKANWRRRSICRCRGKRLSTARAARSISAVRVRREGREWVSAYLMLTGSGSGSLLKCPNVLAWST